MGTASRLAIVGLSGLIALCAQGRSGGPRKAVVPKPNLHGGGAKPSMIPNHQVTTVKFPGFYFSGAEVTAHGACKLVAYRVISDQEIDMDFLGDRSMDNQEDACWFTIRTAGGSASTWIAVDLTEEEKRQKSARELSQARAKYDALVQATGKKWTVYFADGVTATYLAKGSDSEPMKFETRDGQSAMIVVQPNNSVLFVDGGCIRSGHLADGQVKDGETPAGCSHPGRWTATVER